MVVLKFVVKRFARQKNGVRSTQGQNRSVRREAVSPLTLMYTVAPRRLAKWVTLWTVNHDNMDYHGCIGYLLSPE